MSHAQPSNTHACTALQWSGLPDGDLQIQHVAELMGSGFAP